VIEVEAFAHGAFVGFGVFAPVFGFVGEALGVLDFGLVVAGLAHGRVRVVNFCAA
jgi:hypothetical protein